MEIIRRIRIRRLVRDLYRSVLGRDPDADGARTYEDLIRRIGPERALPKMLKAFRSSAEYHAREGALAVSYVNSVLASRGTELVNGQPVAHLASLGSYCLPSIIMRNNGLRRYSLPFDWIFSSPGMLIDCLADDFSAFLDRRNYHSISDPSRRDPGAEHELYRDRYGIRELFAHRDPTREEDYLYFTRCVDRFRRLLRNSEAKLFMIMGRANHDLGNAFPRVLEALSGATTNFVLLGVHLLDPADDGQCALSRVTQLGSHSLYRYRPSSYHMEAGYFPDRLDEWTVLRLVYRYRLALKDSPASGLEAAEQTAEAVREFRTQTIRNAPSGAIPATR